MNCMRVRVHAGDSRSTGQNLREHSSARNEINQIARALGMDIWLPGMDSNHELDRFLKSHNFIDSKKSLKSPKASKAGSRYKIGTKYFCLVGEICGSPIRSSGGRKLDSQPANPMWDSAASTFAVRSQLPFEAVCRLR